jgi:hypothetical protein
MGRTSESETFSALNVLVSCLEFRVWVAKSFRFEFEFEGLKGGVGAIAPIPYSISLRLKELRAIGF